MSSQGEPQELNELDAELSTLWMQRAPLLVAVLDRDRRILQASVRFVDAFGDGTGRPCHQVCAARDEPCDPCPVQALFEGQEVAPAEKSLFSRDGCILTCTVSAFGLEEPGDEPEQALLILEDRTEVTELREQIARGDRLANVGLTAAGLAHTIKNILGGMEGAIYTVDTGLEKGDDARIRSGWEMVSSYIEQVNALVLNLLDYTRPTRTDRQETDPRRLVEDVVELFASKAGLVDVVLRAQYAGATQPIWIDEPVIHACVSNLVTNALDACMWDPDETKDPEVVVSVSGHSGGGVVIEVRDNGIGISEDNQRKVLAASFTTKGLRGTGLGLLLTRQAVEQHGGEITFVSVLGEGTCFRVELPVGQRPSRGADSAR
jgi:signal transduction histidine kinase